MILLGGLFLPTEQPPVFLRPVSFALPRTYRADVLEGDSWRGNS
jgi:hypothetical protein